MSYLLRKFSLPKWSENKSRTPDNYTADSITGCIKTQGNTLSTWLSDTYDFDSDDVKDLIAGLASTMQKPDTIDLVWLEEEWLKSQKIELEQTIGQSKIAAVNSLHYDLSNLDYEKLKKIATHIVEQIKKADTYKTHKRIRIAELTSLVKERVDNGLINKTDLPEAWIRAIEK